MTVEAAAAYYLAHVKPYNKMVLTTAWKKYGKKNTLKAQKKYWALVAKAADTWVNDLKSVAWPEEAAADIRALVKTEIIFQHRALVASRSKSWGALLGNAADAFKANSKGADLAAIVRDDLGLPSN